LQRNANGGMRPADGGAQHEQMKQQFNSFYYPRLSSVLQAWFVLFWESVV